MFLLSLVRFCWYSFSIGIFLLPSQVNEISAQMLLLPGGLSCTIFALIPYYLDWSVFHSRAVDYNIQDSFMPTEEGALWWLKFLKTQHTLGQVPREPWTIDYREFRLLWVHPWRERERAPSLQRSDSRLFLIRSISPWRSTNLNHPYTNQY